MTEAEAPRSPQADRVLVALALVVVGAAHVEAQNVSGLVAPRKSRDELVREWDLNSDGTIDQGEAEVAASRMRRERAELRLNSGIDPVTGLPRGESPLDVEPLEGDAAAPKAAPADEPPPATTRRDSKTLPGTRVPRPSGPKADLPGTSLPGRGPSGQPPAAAAPPLNRSGVAGTRADADRRRQPLTGGVRAGGLAARAGYGGAEPARPLNAGLPVPPKTAPATTPAAPPRGGLVPGPRPTPPPAQPTRTRDMYDPY